MNGQLYQECPICGTDPVCVDCEKCQSHCTCPSDEEKQAIVERQQSQREINAGFTKIVNYITEFAINTDKAKGETFLDTRRFFVGAGYGTGYEFKQDGSTLYMVYYTGSRVDDWATVVYKLTDEDDGFGNGNADIVNILRQLSNGTPLTNAQKRAFTPA